MSKRRLFGTDGIRGLANTDPMTPEVALRLGMAIAARFRAAHVSATGPDLWRHGRIVIGKDTRLSGYLFETALSSGIVSMGADVMLCGPLPTPGIAFITSSMRADAGVVISASHNPYHDNGLKIFARERTLDGVKLVVDCGNGAAYRVAPEVFTELGAKVVALGVDPDGKNINDGAGALHAERMCEVVKRERADLGVALDGDADRVIICDERGQIVD